MQINYVCINYSHHKCIKGDAFENDLVSYQTSEVSPGYAVPCFSEDSLFHDLPFNRSVKH